HVERVWRAIALGLVRVPRQGFEIVHDRRDPRLSRIATLSPAAIDRKSGIGRALGIGIGDAIGRRLSREIAHVLPWQSIGSAYHGVLHCRTAHHRLMEVIAHGVFIGQALEERGIALLHVVKTHRVAAAIVTTSNAYEWIQVILTSRWIFFRR